MKMACGKCSSAILMVLLFVFIRSAYPVTNKLSAYQNPLKGDIGVHDPVMIQQDSVYYVYHTGALIQIKSSTDRITWKQRGSIFSAGPAWFKTYVPENDGKDCWAPDISFRNGKYWLYYSVSTFGKRVSAIGLATSPTLNPASSDYKWTDQGMIINSTNSNNYNCIDPNCFVDTDGRVWLNYGSWNSGIKMVELNPETGKLLSANPTVLSLAARKSNSTGIEAPFIIKRGEYYYLFVSWDVCCKGVESTYNIRVGRASKVTGPYIDKDKATLSGGGGTLIDSGDERWIGPGHNGIFTGHDTIFLVNHAYDAQANGNSKLMIRPLYWDKDGWPTLDASKGEATAAAGRKAVTDKTFADAVRPVMIGEHGIRPSVDRSTLFMISGKQLPSGNGMVPRSPGIYLLKQTAKINRHH